jgi:hypothetical protein
VTFHWQSSFADIMNYSMGSRTERPCARVAGFAHHNPCLSLTRLRAPAIICKGSSDNRGPFKPCSFPASDKSSIKSSSTASCPLADHNRSIGIKAYSSSPKFSICVIIIIFPIHVLALNQQLDSVNSSSQSRILRCYTVITAIQATSPFQVFSLGAPSILSRL